MDESMPGDDYPALSEDLMTSMRQVAPPSHASGRHDWMEVLAWVAGGIAAASAVGAAVLYAFFL